MNAQADQQEKIDRNVRRAAGIAALRKIRRIVDEEVEADAARARLLRLLLRYGWIALLAAAGLLVYFMAAV
jgi:hypothetical protein